MSASGRAASTTRSSTPAAASYEWRRAQGIGDDEVAIGFVGRLVMEKGLDVFSDTIDQLDRRGVRHRVLVIGEGPARGWFERRLPDAIFVGFQKGEDLGRAVASADMLFNPSVTETFGNVTLEAMATRAARGRGARDRQPEPRRRRCHRPPGPPRRRSAASPMRCSIIAKIADARRAAGEAGQPASARYGWDQVNQALVDTYLRIVRQRAAGGRARGCGPSLSCGARGRTMTNAFESLYPSDGRSVRPRPVRSRRRRRAPLADRLRPRSLDEVVGQDHLTGPAGAIGRMVAAGRLSSMILWGPPGTGKTTIARLLADAVGLRFAAISAVFSGVADLKKMFAEAREHARLGKRTLLFVDEIHRFNRAQQDGFLPYVEDGTVILVGATTENPSFELNAALLSRAQVLILNRLDAAALDTLLARAEAAEGRPLPLEPAAREALVASADGDGRFLLNQAETLFSIDLPAPLDPAGLAALLHRRVAVYDKDREGHYNLISALHKSLRGSDPQAALYYLARMLVAGEEPLYVLRRLVRFASRGYRPRRSAGAGAMPRRQGRLSISSARPRANSRSCRPASIAPPRPNRTPPTRRRRPRGRRRATPDR